MSGRADLSICICTRNATGRMDRFLPALLATLASSDLIIQLVIVDDGSTDRTFERARALAPDAVVVAHDRNRGAAAARNTAARNADAEWLLFLDDDATIEPENLRLLWSGRRHDQCVLPQVRGPEGHLQNSMLLRRRFLEPRFDHVADPLPTVAYPLGTCFLLHRDVYWGVGGFDERFFPNYFEDTAFGFQLRRRGIAIRMLEGAQVVHWQHGAAASGSPPERIQRALFENRWVFCMTQLSGWRRVAVMAFGLPRTAVDSARRRSLGPIHGYFRACRRLVELVPPWTLSAAGGER
jgi:glycosyltransferase involved in cell wall biosynthesis